MKSTQQMPCQQLPMPIYSTQLVLSSSPNWCTAFNLSPHPSQTQVVNIPCDVHVTIVYLQSGYKNNTALFQAHF